MGTIVVLDLMGGVALLLWGLHMVHSGILRAFGSDLRHLLSKALGNRFAAFAAGLGLTAVLQSSTATGLMTASFASEGLVGLVPALAIMLGANVGTTLIVQVLTFNVAAAAPVLFLVGLVAFRGGSRTRVRNLGRAAIGLGLILLALHILLDTLAPAEHAPGVRTLLDAITGDPVLCIVIAAALTCAAHSSVATVLLIMSLAYSHFITPAAALALVLGANLGSAINPVIEGTHRGDPASYRLPTGNLLNRLIGIALITPFLRPIADAMIAVLPDPAKMTAASVLADGKRMKISGPEIVTPGGKQTRGDYSRHSFVYVVPAGEAGAGETVSIILLSEYLAHARQGAADAPIQVWNRCPPGVANARPAAARYGAFFPPPIG